MHGFYSTSSTSSGSSGYVALKNLYPSDDSNKPWSSESSNISTKKNKDKNNYNDNKGDKKYNGIKGYDPHRVVIYLQFSVIYNFSTAHYHISH